MNTQTETLHVAPALSVALVTETYVPEGAQKADGKQFDSGTFGQ